MTEHTCSKKASFTIYRMYIAIKIRSVKGRREEIAMMNTMLSS